MQSAQTKGVSSYNAALNLNAFIEANTLSQNRERLPWIKTFVIKEERNDEYFGKP